MATYEFLNMLTHPMNAAHSSTQLTSDAQRPVPMKIIKRNLQEVDFDVERLQRTLSTIRKQHKEFSRENQTRLLAQILRQLRHKQGAAPYPSVLQLQDAIEHSLLTNAYFKSAQYFIVHRAEKRILRQQKHRLTLLIQAMQLRLTEHQQQPVTNTVIQNNKNWQALCLSLFEEILNQVLDPTNENPELSENLKDSLMSLPAEVLHDLLTSVEEKMR